MTRRSTRDLTALPTEPPAAQVLVVLTLECRGTEYRLRAAGGPIQCSWVPHEWRFSAASLSAGLLDEVGACMDEMSVTGLLVAVGMQSQLGLELERVLGDLKE